MSQNGALSANQRKALGALLCSTSVVSAAERAGLSSRTLWRYLAEPAFAAALSTRELAIVAHAARRLAQELEATLDVLVTLRDDMGASDTVRLRACSTLLSALLDLRGLDFERRLSQLEAVVFGGSQT